MLLISNYNLKLLPMLKIFSYVAHDTECGQPTSSLLVLFVVEPTYVIFTCKSWCVSSFVFCCYVKCWQKPSWGWKCFLFCFVFCLTGNSLSVREAKEGRWRQELKVGMLLSGLLPLSCSATFSMWLRPPCPGVEPPTVDMAMGQLAKAMEAIPHLRFLIPWVFQDKVFL